MSKHRYVGGIISATLPTPSQSSASGVWTLDEAEYYQKQGNWPPGGGNDPYFRNNVLLLHGDGTNGAQNNTFLDSSTNNFTVTRNGNTTQGSFNPYVGPGCWSVFFNGSTDYLSASTSPAFGFGTGDFTVEYWIYATSWSTTPTIIDLRAAAGTSGFSDYITTVGVPNMYWHNTTVLTSTLSIPLNTWTHVAYTRASNTIRIFVNGALGASGTSSSDLQASVPCKIGATFTPSNYFSGYLSNVKITKGAALYTAAFTPSTTPIIATSQTSLLTCNNNGFNDLSATNNLLTRAGSTLVSKFSPFTLYQTNPASYSGYFDGTGDYATIPASPNLYLGASDFTVEAWVYLSGTQTTTYGYQVLGTYAAVANGYALVVNRSTGGPIGIAWSNGSPTAILVTYGTYLNTNTWYHIAVVRTGSAVKIFLNGVAVATGTDPTNDTVSQTFYIGSQGAGQYFPGSISNVRITKGVAVYTANFTPSIAPLTATTTVPATQSASVAFDGTGDYLTTPVNQGFGFGTGDFTWEAWIYANNTAGTMYIYDTSASGDTTATGRFVVLTLAGGYLRLYTGALTTQLLSSAAGAITANTWTHIAITRSGTTGYMFIQGALVATGSVTTNFLPVTASGTNRPIIGANGYDLTAGFNGQISNLRVAKGVAVYTTAFTPPTSALTATTTVSSSQSNSVAFDGNGDYLSIANNAALYFGTGDFTAECWFYLTGNAALNGASTRAAQLFSCVGGGGTPTAGWGLAIVGNSTTTGTGFDFQNRINSTTIYTIAATVAINQNAWNHVAVVRSGTTTTIYLNGTSVGSGTLTNQSITSSDPLWIGRQNVTNYTGDFPGYISNVRIVKGQALYTAAFTPSTTPLTTTSQGATASNVSLLTCQNNLVQDNSLNLFAITANGDAKPASANPFVSTNGIGGTSYSGSFDGTGDYLTIANNAAFNFGTGDFTVEFWLYAVSGIASNARIISNEVYTGVGIDISWEPLGNGISWYVGGTGYRTPLPTTNTWNHVAFCRSGTTLRTFLNGALANTYTGFSANITSANALRIGALTSLSNPLLGSVSNLRLVKGQALYTASFSPSTTPLTTTSQGATAANVSLLTCQNSTFIDNSPNAFAITATGDAKADTFNPYSGATELLTCQNYLLQDNSAIQKLVTGNGDAKPSSANPFVSTNGIGGTSYSVALNGTTDYLSLPTNAQYDVTGDFTAECWFYSNSTAQQNVFSINETSFSAIRFQLNTSQNPWFLLSSTGAAWNYNNAPTTAIAKVNAWNHVAFTRSGSTVYGFLNGVLVSTGTLAGSLASGGTTKIGTNAGVPYYFSGSISNFRFVNGTALYTSSFAPPTGPLTAVTNTKILTCQSTTFVDNSSIGAVITANGTPKTDTFNPYSGGTSLLTCQSTTFIDNSAIPQTLTANGDARPRRANPFVDTVTGPTPYDITTYGGSAYFDGTGDYLGVASNAAFAFGTGDFTIECWFLTTSSGVYQRFWWFGDDNDNTNISVGNAVQFGGASQTTITGSTIYTNNWYHFAYVRSSGSGKLYLNGAQVGSTTANSYNSSARTFYIGATGAGANPFFGYISNLRIVKGTAVYTGPFVPPAAPVTAVTGTQLLVNGTNAGIFDNTTTVDLETVGSAQVSTSVVKYGTGSISFNGLNSYLISPIPAPPWLLFTNTADWTIEFWFYTGTSTGQMGLFDTYYSNTSPYSGLIIQIINGTINTYDGGANRATTTTYANSAWHHFAWVNSGGTSRVYIDGTNVTMGGVTSWTTSSNIYKATAPLQIGRDFQSGYFNGYLDEIRITKGYARYTANFTPPAGPFPNY